MDAIRKTANKEDQRLKEYVLVNLCFVISKEEIVIILKLAKNEFRSKHRVNNIMFGKVDEVVRDTEIILKKILIENQYEVNPVKEQDGTNLEVQS